MSNLHCAGRGSIKELRQRLPYRKGAVARASKAFGRSIPTIYEMLARGDLTVNAAGDIVAADGHLPEAPDTGIMAFVKGIEVVPALARMMQDAGYMPSPQAVLEILERLYAAECRVKELEQQLAANKQENALPEVPVTHNEQGDPADARITLTPE